MEEPSLTNRHNTQRLCYKIHNRVTVTTKPRNKSDFYSEVTRFEPNPERREVSLSRIQSNSTSRLAQL